MTGREEPMPDQRGVAGAGLLLAAVLALCRIASLGKELLVAGQFGAGEAIDAYALALLVPALALAFYANSVRRAFLVEYPRQVAAGEGTTFTNRYLCQVLAVSTVLAVITRIGLPWLWPQLVTADRLSSLNRHLDTLNAPIAGLIVPVATVSALTAVLNARKSFAKPQWTHILPTLSIVFAVLARGTGDGPQLLAWSLLLGTVIQAIVLTILVHRAGHTFSSPRGSLFRESGRFAAVVLPFLLLDALGQANVLVDRAMAGGLDQGRLSVLYWSALGKDFLSGTLVASMLWVLLPHFADQVGREDLQGLRKSCSRLVRFAAVLLLPLSSLVLIAGHTLLPSLSLGALEHDDFQRMGLTLGGYAWGLFPELAGLAMVQAILVLGRWKQVAMVGLFGLFLPNLVLNLLLIDPLQEVGLALSTALTAWLLLVIASWSVHRSFGFEDGPGMLKSIGRSCGFSLLSGIAGWAVIMGLGTGATTGVVALATTLVVYLFLCLGRPGHADARHVFQRLTRLGKREPSD